MPEYLFIAVADVRYLPLIPRALSFFQERLRPGSPRLGVLVRMSSFTPALARACRVYGVPLLVDNGAFDILSKKDLDSPLSRVYALRAWARRVAHFIIKNHDKVDAVALPDIPVHGSRFVPREERLRRIELTAELHALAVNEVASRRPEALSKALAVVQGYTYDEYVLSYRLLTERVDKPIATFSFDNPVFGNVLAVGSICVRKPYSAPSARRAAGGKGAGTLSSLLPALLNSRDIPHHSFHFFGLHMTAFRAFSAHRRFHSSDTGGHGVDFRWRWNDRLKCRRPDFNCYVRSIALQLARAGLINRASAFEIADEVAREASSEAPPGSV